MMPYSEEALSLQARKSNIIPNTIRQQGELRYSSPFSSQAPSEHEWKEEHFWRGTRTILRDPFSWELLFLKGCQETPF